MGRRLIKGVMETKETWRDKGREGTPKKWGDVCCGWSQTKLNIIYICTISFGIKVMKCKAT